MWLNGSNNAMFATHDWGMVQMALFFHHMTFGINPKSPNIEAGEELWFRSMATIHHV